MNSPDDLFEIIKGCKNGDNDSFSRLVDLYSRRLYGYFYRLSGNRALSDDLLSEVFVKLVKKIRQDTRHELIPLIFITAHPRTTKNIEEYYDTGVVDLISKPFNHNVLRGKVAVFLEMYKQKQQIDRQNNALESLVKELNNSIQELQTAHIERDKAFADLQKSAETEHALINASLDSVMLIEPDGTIVAHNEIMAKKLNLTSGKLAGSCVYDLLPGETASFRKQKVAEVMDTGNPLRFEDCQSDLIFQQHSLYPIKDAEGNTYRLAIFVHDITQ